jgi:myo-inositol catabolism protein IolH
MKLAVDPCLLKQLTVPEMFESVATAGYKAIELSPRDGFLVHRQDDRPQQDVIRSLKLASGRWEIEIASLFIVQPWASAHPGERNGALRALKVAIDTAAELGCQRINTEFTGTPENPSVSREAFLQSVDEILPLAESRGITLVVEPHPYDFIETNEEAVDLISAVGSSMLRYLFCAPHMFYLGQDIAHMIDYAKDVLAHVHLADTYRPERVILNPPRPGTRIHQHLDIGQGEIDWGTFSASLARTNFSGLVTVAVFAWPDRAVESMKHNREAALHHLGGQQFHQR